MKIDAIKKKNLDDKIFSVKFIRNKSDKVRCYKKIVKQLKKEFENHDNSGISMSA